MSCRPWLELLASIGLQAFPVAGSRRQDDKTELGLTDIEWKKGADAGFAPTPSVNAHGGVLVQGEIVHQATILVSALRRYDEHLAPYLLGLALAGLRHAAANYILRSGCWLVPAGPAHWQRVFTDGRREDLALDADAFTAALKAVAADWASAAGVTLGGDPQVHDYDPKAGKRTVAKKEETP